MRRLSRKFKKSFNKGLSKLAFKVEPSNKSNAYHCLITGGSGHLGTQLALKLVNMMRDFLRRDVEVWYEKFYKVGKQADGTWDAISAEIIEDKLTSSMPYNFRIVLLDLIPPSPELVAINFVEYIQGSFVDYNVMKTALDGIVTVFHLAAVGMTGKFSTNRKACMDINAVGTTNLLFWCRQKGVRRFIYTSSVGVIFNGKPLIDATEDVPRAENYYNYYCESKSHAETIVQNASCEQLKTCILRFNGIYGPGEKRVTERVANFMRSGWWIGICKSNGIEAKTQLSSVDNCIQGLIRAERALRSFPHLHGQIYNIMDEEQVGTFSFWTPLNHAIGFTNEMFTIPPFVMRMAGFFCEVVANYFHHDPFMSVLEVDLLLVNNTFSLEKAKKELEYDPYPSPMPKITEMYRRDANSPEVVHQKRQIFFLKSLLGSGGSLISIIFLYHLACFFISSFA